MCYCRDYVTRYETLKQFQNTLSTCGRISSKVEFTEHVQNTTLKTYSRGNLRVAHAPPVGGANPKQGKELYCEQAMSSHCHQADRMI